MLEIARVTLFNEMDLILAHRRSMKLAEMTGLSLAAQTTFATAVSEVSRTTLEHGRNGCLILGITAAPRENRSIVACIKNDDLELARDSGSLAYARKLVDRLHVQQEETDRPVTLFMHLPHGRGISQQVINNWKTFFVDEAPISPYDEIKRKNEQLQSLADRLEGSENLYRTLTNSLPMIIFSLSCAGAVTYANEWLTEFTGFDAAGINAEAWRNVLHPDDLESFHLLMNPAVLSGNLSVKIQCRLRQRMTGDYFWHLLSISPVTNEEGRTLQWTGFLVDIHAQKMIEQTLKDNRELTEARLELERHKSDLEQNIQELNRSNYELQQFAFVASHDLQEPVRKMLFYSDYLLGRYGSLLDKRGSEYLANMQSASQRMRSLIHDLLSFSQVNKTKIQFRNVSLNDIAQEALQDLEMSIEEKGASIEIGPLPTVQADPVMMRQLFENLLSNALKYGREGVPPRVRVSSLERNNNAELRFEDEGIGFDDKYISKMFSLFQRLHGREKYEGTGLGLAICRKIVEMHHGTIEAQGKSGQGATFIVTLPLRQAAFNEVP